MLKVDIKRGGHIESTHLVHARVETADGDVLYNTSTDFTFFARSAIKPFQSFLLLKSGAFDAMKLDLRHLALASASHTGSKVHTELVSEWLGKLGLDDTALRCGAHWPHDPETSTYLYENKLKPCNLHNNCSGKHTGFLTVCKHLNFPTADYHLVDHPLQIKLKELLEYELDFKLSEYGIDGCSIPAYKFSFYKMSRAFAKMARLAAIEPTSAAGMVVRAFETFPELTSGKDQYDAGIMKKNPGRILAKGGAEGVVAGSLPEKKISILVKCADGSHRGSQFAFDYLAQKFGHMTSALSPTMTNWTGMQVGEAQVTETTPGINLSL